jgi:hypothetical protein
MRSRKAAALWSGNWSVPAAVSKFHPKICFCVLQAPSPEASLDAEMVCLRDEQSAIWGSCRKMAEIECRVALRVSAVRGA